MPETVEKFQEMKYNRRAKFEDKVIQVKDEKLRRKLGSIEYPLEIHADKQGKHIRSAKTFDESKKKSYLAVDSVEEGLKLSQTIVNKYHGKGIFDRTLDGDWKSTEYVITNRIVGYVLNKDNQWTPTKYAVIHYSKTGTHIVPTLRRKK